MIVCVNVCLLRSLPMLFKQMWQNHSCWSNAHKTSCTHIIYQLITPMFSLPECTVINGLTLRDVLCVDGWLSPQGIKKNRPSPCIDVCMSSSYRKILKVCAKPNLTVMSEGLFWAIVKNPVLYWPLRKLQYRYDWVWSFLSVYLLSLFLYSIFGRKLSKQTL